MLSFHDLGARRAKANTAKATTAKRRKKWSAAKTLRNVICVRWKWKRRLSNGEPNMRLINLIDYVQLAVSLIGATVNIGLLLLVWGDFRWMKANGINGSMRRQQKGRVRQEALRLAAQLCLLWAALIAVALRPELPPLEDYSIYATVVLNRSYMMISVAVLLTIKSVTARMDREFVENYPLHLMGPRVDRRKTGTNLAGGESR